MKNNLIHIFIFPTLMLLFSCGRDVPECSGPILNTAKLQQIQRSLQGQGPRAFLVFPDPINASQKSNIMSTDKELQDDFGAFNLLSLSNPNVLENNFLKVRLHTDKDDLSVLAKPNSNGSFNYAVDDPNYSQAMVYYSILAMQNYIESLGFSLPEKRSLFTMVRAVEEGVDNTKANAFYSHHYFEPNSPHTIQFFGADTFAPAADAMIVQHESTHHFLEVLSSERQIDKAGDYGAAFTEAGAAHEALADIFTQSFNRRGSIGKWLARNYPEKFAAGEPVRTAEAKKDEFENFNNISQNLGDSANLDRYRMAQWLTRVLWGIRGAFEKEDTENGTLFSDRLMLSAVTNLSTDSSISELQKSLIEADAKMHCGLHSASINEAFESRGFKSNVPVLAKPLSLSVKIGGAVDSSGQAISGRQPRAGDTIYFAVTIQNPNSDLARNVRVVFENKDASLIPYTYSQGLGDIPPGQTVIVGGNSDIDLSYAVAATISNSAVSGSKPQYRIKLVIENGRESVFDSQVQL